MPPEPIVPDKHSRFIVVENSADCLHVRTRAVAWWLGGAALLAIVGAVIACLFQIALQIRDGHWLAVPLLLVEMIASCAFLSLFLLGLARERLCVARGEIEYGWSVGKFVLTRKRAALAEITELKSDDNEGAYYMIIKTTRWEARFGSSENGPATIGAICREIERRRALAPA